MRVTFAFRFERHQRILPVFQTARPLLKQRRRIPRTGKRRDSTHQRRNLLDASETVRRIDFLRKALNRRFRQEFFQILDFSFYLLSSANYFCCFKLNFEKYSSISERKWIFVRFMLKNFSVFWEVLLYCVVSSYIPKQLKSSNLPFLRRLCFSYHALHFPDVYFARTQH